MIPVCIDLETRPPLVHASAMEELAKASKKNPKRTEDSRAEWAACPGNQRIAWAGGALGLASARIIAVGLIVDDEPPEVWASWDDERGIVSRLASRLQGIDGEIQWVGHNIAAFDLPLLRLASMRHGLSDLRDLIPTYRYSDRIWDNMARAVQPAGSYSGVTADALARAVGLPGKGDLAVMDWPDLWSQCIDGRTLEEVTERRLIPGSPLEAAKTTARRKAAAMAKIRARVLRDVEVEWATFEKMIGIP